jgi:thimet oligopeptidase
MNQAAQHHHEGAEVFWSSPENLKSRCDHALAEAKDIMATLKSAPEDVGDATTLERYNKLFLALDTEGSLSSLVFNTHPDEKIRNAARICQQEISSFLTELGLDGDLYKSLSAVDTSNFDVQAKRFVDHLLRDFRRSGVDQNEETRKRLFELDQDLVRLGQEFQKNVRTDVRSIEIDDVAELKGLPEDFIKGHQPNDEGKIVITTDYPDFFPFQTYAQNSLLRAELYRRFMQRGYPANKDILMKVLQLRSEKAALLGFPTWAEYNAKDKMVGNAQVVDDFIKSLVGMVRTRSDSDIAQLLKRKRKDTPEAKTIQVWDRFYYAGKVREEDYGFDARTVRPYFAYHRVKKGILDLYSELFGVSFRPLPDEPVWHESVEAWELSQDNEVLGVFYLDMHPRDGKYKHAAMFSVQTGLSGKGVTRAPMASLVCNFPDPADGDGHALMEHNQVVTFFHEFGHLVHQMLARGSTWTTLAGINVEWDFVEAPSQLLEEWAFDPLVLQRFAHHYESNEPIPVELVNKLKRAKNFGKGMHVMRQIFYTAYSFYLHHRNPDEIDLEKFSEEIYRDFSPYPSVEGGHIYANFGHLLGYSSMYYTYQWSLVIAKDLFTRFESEGILNPDVAKAYRDAILVPGGSKDASQLVEDFLGRPYNLDAYGAWLKE